MNVEEAVQFRSDTLMKSRERSIQRTKEFVSNREVALRAKPESKRIAKSLKNAKKRLEVLEG